MALLDELKARDVHQSGHWELKSGRHAETYLQCTIAMGDPAFARRIGRQLADELRDLDANVVCAPGVSSMILSFVVAEALAARMLWFEEGRRGHGLRRGQRVGPGDRVIVVEDVLSTGRTAANAAAFLTRKQAEVVGYAALVDRSSEGMPLPFEPTVLVREPLVTYAPTECPQCVADVPIVDPSA